VSSSDTIFATESLLPASQLAPQESNWYAICTMARHEKRVAQQLQENRIFAFLPLLQQIHRWSDRWSNVEVPMFSCYAFVHIAQKTEERLKVLRTPGVLGFVGSERRGTPIPDYEIENLQSAIREKIPCAAHPFISSGQRIRIRGGSLDGMEGILIRQGREQSVVVSVELLQRSISIRIEGYQIEPV
jgi:transcription antitermination factor NusG